ncbi:MAG: hypothetical protein ACK5LL_07260, partial [Suipraeoptans sp.]
MAQRKRTAENPPITFLKELIRNSESKEWDEAKKEWDIKDYYYISKGYKACPCSSKAINNITIITNKQNSNQLEICNPCAERYLEISESTKIASSLNRVKNNMKLGMNEEAINYLLLNMVIPMGEFECYNAAKGNRNDERIIKCREITNSKLIYFTDYRNKPAFDKIDSILMWANNHPEFDIKPVMIIRNNIINSGIVNMGKLDSILEINGINDSLHNIEEAEVVRKLLKNHICTKNIDYKSHSKYIPH